MEKAVVRRTLVLKKEPERDPRRWRVENSGVWRALALKKEHIPLPMPSPHHARSKDLLNSLMGSKDIRSSHD
jgi:hypothetical protein